MTSLIIGSLVISLLHAVIPNHWLPIIAIGRREGWTTPEVVKATLVCALAHGISTILIGILLGLLGTELDNVTHFTQLIAPGILISLGVFFIYRHHKHKHFHIDDNVEKKRSRKAIISALVIAMFFSPCMEIEAYFLLAGAHSLMLVGLIALMYLTITTMGMLLLVRFAYKGLLKWNWHKWEHNAGIITGWTLVATGIISFFIS